ncbi:MAG: mannitol system component [Thermoanaerobacteraceae bacterium]|jgi:mannitol/fructose-specific phosphotransferase system IIA component|uniref:Mannitol-specific phosphotransferase enzyme IIA component n=1 Tax=Biomaibacter acetigenes TaxID=2316383 RepID=A0A3G2R1K3_9FIRM|nr:PTS sugar transporter subunit IIA [Biomaibacter acetigenes]AYO29313.1 PTS mannitol transporter subunit IIA [Biomaibacter acetigenes]MDK2878662.1 mannitol system component [Thermoanaerobacteraceae bacterium]MDN5313125.1 mannitol system component [Thermoanaerobacteraceae bacterium]
MALNWFKRQSKKKEILTRDGILVKMHAKDKYEAIEMVGKILVKQGKVQASYIDAMKARENMLTTYIGNGIAIPHGVGEAKDKIIESGIAVAQFPEGVEFGENQKAYLVIGIAGKGDEHLNILANIASACEDEKKVKKLINSTSADEIYEMLTEEVS